MSKEEDKDTSVMSEIAKAQKATNLHTIYSDKVLDHIKHTIDANGTMLLVAPRGTGKTESCKDAILDMGNLHYAVWNLATKDRLDMAGIPNMFNPNDAYVKFRKLVDFKPLLEGGKIPNFDFQFRFEKNAVVDEEQKLGEAVEWMKRVGGKVQTFGIEGPNHLVQKAREFIAGYAFDITNSKNEYKIGSSKIEFVINKNPYLEFTVIDCDPVEVVVVFEELDKADDSLYGPLLELIQARSLNGEKLPFLKAILSSSNMQHEGGKRPILPLLDRFEKYLMIPSYEGFLEYSRTRVHAHATVISYLNDNEADLYASANVEEHYADPTPRSWMKVSNLFFRFEKLLRDLELRNAGKEEMNKLQSIFEDKICGLIGENVGTKMIVYFNHYMEFLHIVRPIFDHVKACDYEGAIKAADQAATLLKDQTAAAKIIVLMMTVMSNYVVHIDSLSLKFKKFGDINVDQLGGNQKQEVSKLALETVCLIDSIGKFFYRAITDTTNTDGGNETNILNGDMLIAILRNNISAGMERWKKYVVGQDYRKYVQAYVKAHSKNPEFHYAHYPHVSKASFKEYFAEIPYDTVVDYGNLLTHPYWNYILRKARFDQKTLDDITKGAWTQN